MIQDPASSYDMIGTTIILFLRDEIIFENITQYPSVLYLNMSLVYIN